MRRRGRRGIIVGGMVLGLLMGCNNGIAELEKENSFYKSVVKIGQGFQDIFGIFGNAFGDKLGFNAVKSGDSGSEISGYFDKVKQGLGDAKEKLEGLEKEITSTPHSDTKVVEDVIKNARGVFTKLIDYVVELANVTKSAGKIGTVNSGAKAVASNHADVKTIIDNVNKIVTVAETSGGDIIKKGSEGAAVPHGSAQTNAPAVLGGQASDNTAAKLADKVSEADPWAMIDKIKSSTTRSGGTDATDNDNAGQLATSTSSGNFGAAAKTTADLAAAVALKAMTKDGQFSAHSGTGEAEAVKVAAVSAVNKVLGVIDEIIRRTVSRELFKIREAVKEIKYSDSNGEATEAKK